PRSSDGVGGRCQPGVRLPMQLISSVSKPSLPLSHALRPRRNHPPWAGPSFLRRDKSSLPIASVYCHSEPPATREPTLQRNPVCQCAKKPLRVGAVRSESSRQPACPRLSLPPPGPSRTPSSAPRGSQHSRASACDLRGQRRSY